MSAPSHWSELIPHSGAMRLLDRVLDWNATLLHAVAERHRPHDHPLCDASQQLHAVHLAEYGAQAAAVHGALLAAAREDNRVRPGRLVSLRGVQLMTEYIDLASGHLDVHAECLLADASGAQYAFRIEQGRQPLASGRVAVIYTER